MPESLRKRVIEEWRGLPEPEEKPDRTLSIREVLFNSRRNSAWKVASTRRKSSLLGLKSWVIFFPSIPAR